MGESVQLLKMKQYALNKLAVTEESSLTRNSRNNTNSGHAYETLNFQGERSPASHSTTNQNNGFIANKEYSDWDR